MAGPLLLVGCGKLGGALLAGWLARGVTGLWVIEPAPAPSLRASVAQGVNLVATATELPADFAPRAAVLAVKPQALEAALIPLPPFLADDTLLLSVAAGRTIGFIEARLGRAARIVRAMPNTPAAIGRGMTVLCAGRNAGATEARLAEELMGAVGEVAWIGDEALMDAVTAVSGSGPAYVFLLVEALAEAGVAAGLEAALAMRLARATVAGAGALLDRLPQHAATLRADVTSPGGTTAAALAVLMSETGLLPLMKRAVAAAARRGRELAG